MVKFPIPCSRVKFTVWTPNLKQVLWGFFGLENSIVGYSFFFALCYWWFYFLFACILFVFLTDTFLDSGNPDSFLHKKTDEYPLSGRYMRKIYISDAF